MVGGLTPLGRLLWISAGAMGADGAMTAVATAVAIAAFTAAGTAEEMALAMVLTIMTLRAV
jgi:hypothetical protein